MAYIEIVNRDDIVSILPNMKGAFSLRKDPAPAAGHRYSGKIQHADDSTVSLYRTSNRQKSDEIIFIPIFQAEYIRYIEKI